MTRPIRLAAVGRLTFALSVSVPAAWAARDEIAVDFESMATGAAPDGFTTGLTGEGKPVQWIVVEDDSAPSGTRALAETSGVRVSLPRFGGRFRSWVRPDIDCGIEAMPGLFPGRRRGQGSKTAERRAAGASLTAASVRKSWQHRFDARSSAATAEIDGRAWASS